MNECIRTHRRHQKAAGWCRKEREMFPCFMGGLRLDGLSCRAGVAHVPPSSRLQEGRLHVLLQECQLKNGGGGGLVACDR